MTSAPDDPAESSEQGPARLTAQVSRDDAGGMQRHARAGLAGQIMSAVGLLAEGLQHEEIGRRLGISSETVRTHLRKASDRLGAATRTQAVATALRLGLIS